MEPTMNKLWLVNVLDENPHISDGYADPEPETPWVMSDFQWFVNKETKEEAESAVRTVAEWVKNYKLVVREVQFDEHGVFDYCN
jgi:hypothetical protein